MDETKTYHPGEDDLAPIIAGAARDRRPRVAAPERLRLDRLLGRGGMGEVWQAHDRTLGRQVAVKVLGSARARTEGRRARFLREARLLSSLDHDNVCRVFDYVSGRDADFLVLELIEGETLASLLRRRRPGRREALEIARQIVSALAAAHRQGIVHRDLKPENVMLTRDGRAKVLDFGLARLDDGPAAEEPSTGTSGSEAPPPREPAPGTSLLEESTDSDMTATRIGAVMGTPWYMSPEQARGGAVGPASDLYSLGLVLQQLFGGPHPHAGLSDPDRVLARVRRGESEPATGVPREIAGLIRRLKSADPATRPSAPQMESELKRLAERPQRRLRWGAAIAAVLLVAVGLVKYLVDLRDERNQALRAREEQAEVVEFLAGLFAASQPEEARGRELTARDLLERGVERLETELAGRSLVRARLLEVIGDVYYDLGEWQRAEPLLREALEIHRRELGAEHEETLMDAVDLGNLLVVSERWDEAEQLFRPTLETQMRVLGPDHPDTLKTRNNLADLAYRRGDFDTAIRLHEENRRLRERVLGPLDPFTLATLNNLSVTYLMAGRTDDAVPLFREVLERRRETLGSDHPDTLGSIFNLAALYLDLGQPEESLPLAREAMEEMRRVLGPEHPHTAYAGLRLVQALRQTRRLEEARVVAQEQYEMATSSLPPDHDSMLIVLSMLALTELDVGNPEGAEELYRRVYEVEARKLGPHHHQPLSTLASIAAALQEQGRLEEAAAALEEAREGYRMTLGAEHYNTHLLLVQLADVRTLQGRADDAIRLYETAIEGLIPSLGSEAEQVRTARQKLERLRDELAGQDPRVRTTGD